MVGAGIGSCSWLVLNIFTFFLTNYLMIFILLLVRILEKKRNLLAMYLQGMITHSTHSCISDIKPFWVFQGTSQFTRRNTFLERKGVHSQCIFDIDLCDEACDHLYLLFIPFDAEYAVREDNTQIHNPDIFAIYLETLTHFPSAGDSFHTESNHKLLCLLNR